MRLRASLAPSGSTGRHRVSCSVAASFEPVCDEVKGPPSHPLLPKCWRSPDCVWPEEVRRVLAVFLVRRPDADEPRTTKVVPVA